MFETNLILSSFQLVRFTVSACQLVSFSACASWTLWACLKRPNFKCYQFFERKGGVNFCFPEKAHSDDFPISAPAISVFVENKDGTAFRHSQKNLQKMCSRFESVEACLEKNTYNQSELLNDIFLGFDRKESLTTPKNMVTEELARPSFGRYYTLRPSFMITTNYRRDQLYLNLTRELNYVIHIFDPRFYLGFYNPSLPIVKKIIQPDDTAGRFFSLVLTEVGAPHIHTSQ